MIQKPLRVQRYYKKMIYANNYKKMLKNLHMSKKSDPRCESLRSIDRLFDYLTSMPCGSVNNVNKYS